MSSFEKQSQDKSLAMPDLDNSLAAPTWALLVDTGAATSVAPKSFAPHLELSPAPSTFQLATANWRSNQDLWPEARPSSVPRLELQSQLCHCRCCDTNLGLRHTVRAQLGLEVWT